MLLTSNEKAEIEIKCDEAIRDIEWKNNAGPDDCTTIIRALQSARKGYDGGPTALMKLKPSTNSHSEWMEFVHLVTVYYNMNKTIKKYTILRNRIIYYINMPACTPFMLRVVNN